MIKVPQHPNTNNNKVILLTVPQYLLAFIKEDNARNALKYRKIDIFVKMYTLPEQNNNNSGNFFVNLQKNLKHMSRIIL